MSQTDNRYQMDENKKRRLSDIMIDLVQNTVLPMSVAFRRRTCFADADIVACLTDKHLERFEDLAREILKPNQIREKFSEQYIHDSLSKVILKSIRDGNLNSTSQYFHDMVSDLEDYSICHIVNIPLAGIELTVPSLPIGNIVIKEITEADIRKISAKFDEATSAQKDSDQKTWEQSQKYRAERLNAIGGSVCAEFKAVVESKRVQERAMEETRKVMDIFEYVIAAMSIQQDNSEKRIRVGALFQGRS